MSTFDIKITEEQGVLRFVLQGPATHAHLLRAVTAIINETKARGIWQVLCDATGLALPIGAFEKFEAGVELSRGADRRMRMAVVARVEAIDYVFQNVARNRGAAVSVFRSEDAALHWLQGAEIG